MIRTEKLWTSIGVPWWAFAIKHLSQCPVLIEVHGHLCLNTFQAFRSRRHLGNMFVSANKRKSVLFRHLFGFGVRFDGYYYYLIEIPSPWSLGFLWDHASDYTTLRRFWRHPEWPRPLSRRRRGLGRVNRSTAMANWERHAATCLHSCVTRYHKDTAFAILLTADGEKSFTATMPTTTNKAGRHTLRSWGGNLFNSSWAVPTLSVT